jgi:hypothetical protein
LKLENNIKITKIDWSHMNITNIKNRITKFAYGVAIRWRNFGVVSIDLTPSYKSLRGTASFAHSDEVSVHMRQGKDTLTD